MKKTAKCPHCSQTITMNNSGRLLKHTRQATGYRISFHCPGSGTKAKEQR